MRIALTNPFCWPSVRRGSERFIAELARFLTQHGHDVTTVTSHNGSPYTEMNDGGKRIVHRYLYPKLLERFRVTPAHSFILHCLRTLPSVDAEVIHMLYHTDAWAANLVRRRGHFRTVYQIMGVPIPDHFRRKHPPEHLILQKAIQGADMRLVLSRFAQPLVREHYDCDAEVLPLPVDLDQFPAKAAPVEKPILLSSAAFDDRRKGVRVLLRAYSILKQEIPALCLQLSGRFTSALHAELIDSLPEFERSGIEILGIGNVGDLPRRYREAAVMVLPSMWEAQGMSVLEAFASGTPVALTRHGAFLELAADPATGTLFDPETDGFETSNATGLAEAIRGALALARNPATIQSCRNVAEKYSWSALGPAYQQIYRQALERTIH